VSKMEGKNNFSRHLKQSDGLTRLTLSLRILRQIYATELSEAEKCHSRMTGLLSGEAVLTIHE